MLEIKKEYVVDDNNKPKAVLIDIDSFKKVEGIIEDYGLGKYMEEAEQDDSLSLEEAQKYYKTLLDKE